MHTVYTIFLYIYIYNCVQPEDGSIGVETCDWALRKKELRLTALYWCFANKI
jgi:hypothetical protein